MLRYEYFFPDVCIVLILTASLYDYSGYSVFFFHRFSSVPDWKFNLQAST